MTMTELSDTAIGRFAKRVARSLLDDFEYTSRRGIAAGCRRKGGFGFLPELRPTRENRFLHGLDLTGRTIYDVGAYEGAFTVYFASAVGPSGGVVSFEPNLASYRRLLENVRLNRLTNVRALQLAIGARSYRASLVFPASEPGRGSLRVTPGGLASTDDPPREGDSVSELINVASIDHLVGTGEVPPPDFVKIDVEGHEHEVLLGMQRTIERRRPDLFIELHGEDLADMISNARRCVRLLDEAGYRILHVESRQYVLDRSGGFVPATGHLYCVSARGSTHGADTGFASGGAVPDR